MFDFLKKLKTTYGSLSPGSDITPEVIKRTPDPSLVTIMSPYSVEAEQFRLLKNNILFPEEGKPAKCIMITSCTPGDGKSFVASNLAVSIARSIDEYVLLMDSDLRCPSQHLIFGLGKVKGLSEYLKGKSDLSSILVKTFLNKLTILPGGTLPHNPSELLSSRQMRHLIKEVRQRYSDRFILIDTPPPYITSEVSALARSADGVIIVIKNGKTRKKDVESVIDIYGKEKILGVVNNFAPKRLGKKYQYAYQYYGYKK